MEEKTELFIRLSVEAAAQNDVDKLIELLNRRQECVTLDNLQFELEGRHLRDALEREKAILGRLDAERRAVLAEMDELSKAKKARRRYESKFPFPRMPVFCAIRV